MDELCSHGVSFRKGAECYECERVLLYESIRWHRSELARQSTRLSRVIKIIDVMRQRTLKDDTGQI